ncbi:hypothetical protein [Glaciimonas immobilis]|uniref:DDE domain-containing protein n=1 Tax=Glaciimonas immobilis TaxID=728004 RepID=A0A840RMD5_9BURK|nr:hypothetical protein [Glaciimonas immobilis]
MNAGVKDAPAPDGDLGGYDRADSPHLQDHRAVKRVTKPTLNFKLFRSTKNALPGIERMHMIRKQQCMMEGVDEMSFADHFYALAGQVRPV